MPSHMRDPNTPAPGDQGAPEAQPPQQQTPDAQGRRYASDDRPAPYVNDPQEIEIPERQGPRLWWAWVILAIIVVVGIIWIWFFVIPHPEGSYEDVQGEQAQEQLEEGAAEGESVAPLGVGSQGPNTIRTADGMDWTIDPQGLIAPVEIHGMGPEGVTIAFMPGDGAQTVTIHFVSLQVDGQTYDVGAPDSPVHYNVTAGHGGVRDITGDPTFTVGKDESGTLYGERVLISVDGLDEDAYNGMVLTVEETGEDGNPVQGTISLSSAPAAAATSEEGATDDGSQEAAPQETTEGGQ